MDQRLQVALREAEARRAKTEQEAAQAAEIEQAEKKAAEEIVSQRRARAITLLRPAEEAIRLLQDIGPAHVRRGAVLTVRQGSPPLPRKMGFWGHNRLWELGRRGGWVVSTRHERSDEFFGRVDFFVPLAGITRVYRPSSFIGLAELAEQGFCESVRDPGEGLPVRTVIDARTSLQQFIEVVADYAVTLSWDGGSFRFPETLGL